LSKNATSIWSGYTHQGKVGLIVALQEIKRLAESTPAESLADTLGKWQLVYESAEDFDILNGTNTVWSRHQVKAWTNKNKQSDYSKVLKEKKPGQLGFNTNSVRQGFCYLHVIENITDWADDGTSNPQSIKLYKYPTTNKLYCDFSPAEDVNDVLLEMYEPLIKSITNTDDTHIVRSLWASLEHILDEKIRTAHRSGSSAKPDFTFLEIYTFLCGNNPITASYCHQVKKRLIKFWERHEKLRASTGTEFDEKWDKARKLLEDLCALDTAAFIKAVRIMYPNEAEGEFHPESTGMRQVVYRAFEEIEKELSLEDMSYGAEDIFVLTALSDPEMGEIYAEEICTNIIKNPNFAGQLFVESKLITSTLDGSLHQYLKNGGNDHLLYEPSTLGGVQAEHIRNFANLEFIKIEDAIEELKRV
jgi:hypothetical protein